MDHHNSKLNKQKNRKENEALNDLHKFLLSLRLVPTDDEEEEEANILLK